MHLTQFATLTFTESTNSGHDGSLFSKISLFQAIQIVQITAKGMVSHMSFIVTQYKTHHANQQMALIIGVAIDFHITKAGNEGKPRDFQVPYNKTWQWKRKMKRLSTKSFTLVLSLKLFGAAALHLYWLPLSTTISYILNKASVTFMHQIDAK